MMSSNEGSGRLRTFGFGDAETVRHAIPPGNDRSLMLKNLLRLDTRESEFFGDRENKVDGTETSFLVDVELEVACMVNAWVDIIQRREFPPQGRLADKAMVAQVVICLFLKSCGDTCIFKCGC